MTFIERTDIFRPPLVRLLARHKSGKVLSSQEIADRASMHTYDVQAIASMDSWDSISFGDMRQFFHGCGIGNLEDGATMHRLCNYIRFAGRPGTVPFRYLRNDEDWKTYYRPLIVRWRTIYGDPPEVDWKPLRVLLVRLTPLITKTLYGK